MKAARVSQIGLILVFLSSAVTQAQIPSVIQTARDANEQREQMDRELNRLRSVGRRGNRNPVTNPKEQKPKAKPTAKDLEAIAVSEADIARYAEILKDSRAGLFRLHDAAVCETRPKVYNVEETCPAHLDDKGSAYSFLENEYKLRWAAEISLENSVFRAQKAETLNFLTNIGDVPLENLKVTADGIREMAEFVPSSDTKDVLFQIGVVKKGFRIGKYVYKTTQPLKGNSTYALRSIAYEIRDNSSPFKSRRADIIVVFRIVRTYEDGSFSILWKELQRKNAPKIISDKLAGDKRF